MAIDARIAMGYQAPQFENPLAQLAQVMQIKGIQNQNRLADLKFQEAERGLAEERNTNELYRLAVGEDGTLDRNKLYTLAGQRGMGSKIPAWQKQFSDADKATAEVGKTKAETSKISQEAVTKALDNNRQTLSYVNDPQTAAQWVAAGFSDPVIGPIFSRSGSLEQAIARIPQDPQGFADWKRQNGLGIEKYIEQSKPNVQIRNTGGTTDTLAINPWTGVGQVTGSVRNTQSPDSVASVAAQIRGQNLTDARGREANSLKAQELGILAGAAQPAGGADLGTPRPQVLPWAGQPNPKAAGTVKAKEIERGSKEIEKDVDAARKQASAAQLAQRFIELNKNVNTGGAVDKFGPTRALQGMGNQYAEMESITAQLAPAMREPGSGSSSDYDGKQFERATVGVDKPRQANENIAKAVVLRAQQAQEYADFRQTYLEQNGTLQGADRYWKQYADSNPIFDPKKPGAFQLNQGRKSWQQHFSTKQPAQPATGGLSPAEQQELQELRQRLGKK